MIRIIAGDFRGRRLHTLTGTHTRPTAARVREAMFSALSPLVGGARVLDAFAGSGALGLEALSRGAERVLLMESDPSAVAVCAKNIALVQAEGARLLRGDCLKLLERPLPETPFDLILADPPYNQGWLPRLMAAVARCGVLAPDGLLVAETTLKDSEFVALPPWRVVKRAAYGDTVVYYCRLEAPADEVTVIKEEQI